MGGSSKSKSWASKKEERLFARQQILDSRAGIEDIFSQAQTDQLAAIDAAITGAQSYASQQANARTAGQGLGASNIDGTMGYVLQNLIPQAMQMRAGVYGNTATNRVGSIQNYLGLLNQNASLSAGSKSKKKSGVGNFLSSAASVAAALATSGGGPTGTQGAPVGGGSNLA